MSSRLVDKSRPLRWLSLAATLAFVPKCLLCLAAYTGVGAALAAKLGPPEICGGPSGSSGGAIVWWSMLGIVLGFTLVRRWSKRMRSARAKGAEMLEICDYPRRRMQVIPAELFCANFANAPAQPPVREISIHARMPE